MSQNPKMPPKSTQPSHETAPSSSLYSTRSSKRKVDDVASTTENGSSSQSSRKSSRDELDSSDLPPAKRTRRSTASSNDSPSIAPLNAIDIVPPLPPPRTFKRTINETISAPGNTSSTQSSRKSSRDEIDLTLPSPKKTRRSEVLSIDSPSIEPLNGVENAQIPSLKVNSPSPASEGEDLVQSGVASPSPSPNKAPRGRGRGRGRGGRPAARGRPSRGGFAKAVPAPEFHTVKGMRGKAGRVKRSEDPRIQALHYRKHALRQQFKAVANLQREALAAVSEKSLEYMAKQTDYHKTLPEYKETQDALKKKFDDYNARLDAEYKMHAEYLEKQLNQKEDYERRRYDATAEEVMETTTVEVMHRSLHILRQAETGGNLETTPIYRGILGENVKQADAAYPIPQQYAGPEESVVASEKRKPGRKPKNASPMKKTDDDEAPVRVKSLLYNPIIQAAMAPADIEEASAVPTPAEGSEDEDLESSPEPPSGISLRDKYGVYLPNKPAPRNGAPPQNKFMVKPAFEFEPEEIGIRLHHEKRNNRSDHFPAGIDADPTPKNFHFDQFARGHNSAHNKADDLDPELVAKHKVHPVYGLPIPGSVNPDPAPKDWSAPLPRPNPVVFYTQTTTAVDTFHTSRSVQMIETPKEFEEYEHPSADSKSRVKMGSILHRFWANEDSLHPEAEKVERSLPKENPNMPRIEGIDPMLLKAVNEAAAVTSTSGSTPRRGYDPVRDSIVSENGYSSPYSKETSKTTQATPSVQTMQAPPPVAPAAPQAAVANQQENPISLLVNAAELRRSMPPPSHNMRPTRSAEVPREQRRWGPYTRSPGESARSYPQPPHGMHQSPTQTMQPAMMPQPQSMLSPRSLHQQPHGMQQSPSMHQQSPPTPFFSNPQTQLQYSPPRTNLPGGPLRQLQPAPPKPRNPQPPPRPPRPYYGGYQ